MIDARWAHWVGWGMAGLLALLAAGGAATRPDGWVLGTPALGAGAVALCGIALLAFAVGARGAAPLLGLAPALVVALVGPSFPGGGALTGPPLFSLLAAAAVLSLAAAPPRWARQAFVPAMALLYVAGAARVQREVGPQGDEPHYLMVADSLLRDGDLALDVDYAEGRYRSFHPAPLDPHYRVRGGDGRIYSLHAVGLSVLVLPAYAAFGYAGASFFMALLGVWLAAEVRRLVAAFGARAEVAAGTAWLVALSPPLLHYAGLVFTEVPAALATAIALRLAREARSSAVPALGGGALLALLPWLNVRYAALAMVVIAYALSRRPTWRAAAAWSAVPIVSAAAIALYHQALYGFLDPRRVYGRRPELSFDLLPTGVPGLLLDQEFGLLAYAPLFALAVPGLWILTRRSRRDALAVATLALVVLLLAGSWPMWRGGFNPPARFLVPVLPALAIAVAARLGTGVSAGAALLAGWGLWAGLAGWWEPRLVHRDRDGTAPLLRTFSGAEEWTRLLPGFVLDDSSRDRQGLAWLWTAALLAAAWPLRRPAPEGGNPAAGLAAATAGLVVACAAASSLATARTLGRDAVRVVGRPGLTLPAAALAARSDARWSTRDLAWGPLYEPHRSPLVAGGRLPLPPGRYRLEIVVEPVGGALTPPHLRILDDLRAGGDAVAMALEGDRLVASWAVPPGRTASTLLLEGGSPFLVRDFRLSASTSAAGPGLIP